MKSKTYKKAQSVIEYTILLTLIVGLLVYFAGYSKTKNEEAFGGEIDTAGPLVLSIQNVLLGSQKAVEAAGNKAAAVFTGQGGQGK